jgi:hypothetical protein
MHYCCIDVPLSVQEIEKTENETILSSLLMPWELGPYYITLLIAV